MPSVCGTGNATQVLYARPALYQLSHIPNSRLRLSRAAASPCFSGVPVIRFLPLFLMSSSS